MISSQLQSQLFSKIATWDILTANNLVWGHRCPMRIAQLKIEVWSTDLSGIGFFRLVFYYTFA